MKKIIKTTLLLLLCNFSMGALLKDANLNHEPFLGIWEYRDGNNIFRINIWENSQGNGIRGHYKLLKISSSGNEVLIDQSNKEILEGSNENWDYSFGGGSSDGIKLEGLIRDVTPFPKDVTWIDGIFWMKIIPPVPGNPTQATWKVSYDGPIYYEARFQIPTNCILTKVE